MKVDLPVIPPADIQQGWDGQFQVFSWYNFVLNIPTAVFIVTTHMTDLRAYVDLAVCL